MQTPALYIVATPIGNLEDLTPRAKSVLAAVDVIAAEDTRTAKRLLSHLGVHGKRLVSYQDHGEAERAVQLVAQMRDEGLSVAVVSDAGTPCISDPGYRIVAAAKAAGIAVHPIPGPSALTALASAAGLATDRLLFVGFLPAKAGAQKAEIQSWAAARATVCFFEATRRLARTLAQVAEVYPGARVAIGRELTKLYEEIVTLPIGEAAQWVAAHPTLKGEAAVMVELPRGGESAGEAGLDEDALIAEAARAFAQGATLKDLLQKYKDAGYKRTELYDLLLRAKES